MQNTPFTLQYFLNSINSSSYNLLINSKNEKYTSALNSENAAVLIIIIANNPNNPQILFTKRSNNLPNHAGQISFPGGKYTNNDKDLLETALRETYEEIGIEINRQQIIGKLPGYLTASKLFKVTPFITVVNNFSEKKLVLAKNEVEEIILCPFFYFLDTTHYQNSRIIRNSNIIHFKETIYNNYKIWGLTANILYDLAQLIKNNLIPQNSDHD